MIDVIDVIDVIDANVDDGVGGVGVGDVLVHNDDTMLSLSLVHEILEYIHIDFKNIIHREGNAFFDDDESRLPLSLIMNSGLEDYFERVLLSDRYRDVLCDECAKRGQLGSLKWARSKGCPWTKAGWQKGTCYVASRAGHLHILQWARANGCDWDSMTCSGAAGAGHLHILQ